MKHYLPYCLMIFIIGLLCTVLFWIITPASYNPLSYRSPLPDFLTLGKNSQVRLLDLWQPIVQQALGNTSDVESFAKAVLMYDMTTNTTLFEKNTRERLPMASLTKIMTAIIALENSKAGDRYVVHAQDLVGEDSMGLESGEILTSEELLYGLFLNSGNDAAEVFANNYPKGRVAFVKAMNDKAVSLGLTDTKFSNPSGLQGDGEQYTTAYDLLVITQYALEHFPLVREVAQTYEQVIPQTAMHKEYHLFNETNLLTSYPGVKGMKTGYTPEAGMCLVTYFEYKDHRIVGILLNSVNRRQEMKDLLDYSLNSLGVVPPEHD